jgi:hypothetical protein
MTEYYMVDRRPHLLGEIDDPLTIPTVPTWPAPITFHHVDSREESEEEDAICWWCVAALVLGTWIALYALTYLNLH